MKKLKRILLSISAFVMIGAIILCSSSEVQAFGASNLITGTGTVKRLYTPSLAIFQNMPVWNVPEFIDAENKYTDDEIEITNLNYGNGSQYLYVQNDKLKLAYATMTGAVESIGDTPNLENCMSFYSMTQYWSTSQGSSLPVGKTDVNAFDTGREYGSRLTIMKKFELTQGETYYFSCVAAQRDGNTTANFYIVPHVFNEEGFLVKQGAWAGKDDAPQIYDEVNDGDYVIFILRAANGDTSIGGGIDCAMVWNLDQMEMFEEDHNKAFQMSQYPIMNIIYKPFNYTVSKRLNGSSTTTFVKNYERYGVTKLDIGEIETDVAIPAGYHLIGWEVKPTQTLTAEGQAALNVIKDGKAYFSSADLNDKLLNPDYYYSAMFQNVELVAVYEPNDYTVEFNSNIPNNNTTKTQTHTYGSSKALLANSFAYTGYTFSKWTTEANGTGTSYNDKASVSNLTTTKDGLVKLYAQWIINNSTLTVNPNGGTWNGSTASQSFTQNYNTTLSIPNPSNRTGYTFNGWTKSSTFTAGTLNGTTFTFGATKNGTGTLTANWDIHTSTITVNPNGGTWNSNTTSQSFTQNYNTTKTIANPTRAGYTFAGWTVSGNAGTLSGTTFTFGSTKGGTGTLTAKWTPNTYSVALDGNGATNTDYDKSVTATFNAAMPTLSKLPIRKYTVTLVYNDGKTSNSTTDVNYTFNGYWSAKTNGTQYYNTNGTSAKNYDIIGGTTLYAQWTAKSITLPTPTKNGYTFDGWNTKTDGTGTKITTTTYTPTANITLYAQWKPNTYPVTLNGNGATSTNHTTSVNATFNATMPSIVLPTRQYKVTYNANGGTVSKASDTVNYTFNGYFTATSNGTKYYNANGSSAKNYDILNGTTLYAQWTPNTTTLPTPTRTGYKFNGWNTKADGTGTSIPNGTYTPTANITLYAQWTPITYEVEYLGNKPSGATNNVTGTMPNSTHTYGVAQKLNTNQYKLTGWTFKGWKTEAGSSYVDQATVESLRSTQDAIIKLYAQWTANTYTIKYNANKPASATNNVTGTMSNSSHTYDTAKNLDKNQFDLTGWTFVGWTLNADGSGNVYSDEASVKNLIATHGGTVNLYAKWEVKGFNVTLDDNGATSTDHTKEVNAIFDTLLPNIIIPKKEFTITYNGNLGTPSRDKDIVKYAFNGYFYNNVQYYSNTGIGIKYDIEDNVTFVAKWTSTGVTFPTANRPGYIFKGWSTSKTGGTTIEGSTFTPTSNITLYAVWEPITYTIVFKPNEPNGTATGTISNQLHIYDSAQALLENKFELTGYKFSHWNTKADGSGISYENKEIVSNLTTADKSTITLYAQWTVNKYTVALNGNGATSTDHTTKVEVNYLDNLSDIILPKREYTIKFEGDLGKTVLTDKIVAYKFTGYFDEGHKMYYTSAGSGIKWDKTSNYTLNAEWLSQSIILPECEKDGYEFVGWIESGKPSTVYLAGDEYTPTKDVTLNPVWKAKIFVYDIDIFNYNPLTGEGLLNKHEAIGNLNSDCTASEKSPVYIEYEGYRYVASTTITPSLTEDNIIYRFYEPILSIKANAFDADGSGIFSKKEVGILDMTVTGYASSVTIKFPQSFLGTQWTNPVTGNTVALTNSTNVKLNITNPTMSGRLKYQFVTPDKNFNGASFDLIIIAKRNDPCEIFQSFVANTNTTVEVQTECELQLSLGISKKHFFAKYLSSIRGFGAYNK